MPYVSDPIEEIRFDLNIDLSVFKIGEPSIAYEVKYITKVGYRNLQVKVLWTYILTDAPKNRNLGRHISAQNFFLSYLNDETALADIKRMFAESYASSEKLFDKLKIQHNLKILSTWGEYLFEDEHILNVLSKLKSLQ